MMNFIRGGRVHANLKGNLQSIYTIKNKCRKQQILPEYFVAKNAFKNNITQVTNVDLYLRLYYDEGSAILRESIVPDWGLDCHSCGYLLLKAFNSVSRAYGRFRCDYLANRLKHISNEKMRGVHDVVNEGAKDLSLKSRFSVPLILLLLMTFGIASGQSQSKQSYVLQGKVVSAVDGKPLQGVSVHVEADKLKTSTKKDGSFNIAVSQRNGKVKLTYVGYKTQELEYTSGVVLSVQLNIIDNQLEEVEVVSTGFQKIPKERATGSFELIDNRLLNKRIGSSIMDRLENASVSTRFEKDYQWADQSQYAVTPQFNFDNRGKSVMSGSPSRTIVLDNVLFEGDLRDINPNDIESVSILKDAVATSIWGANGGGGVIVLTTKKGNYNSPFRISFNSNVTVQEKPNIYALPFMKSADFIEYESFLFKKGYYNSRLNNKTSFPTVTPVVDLLNKLKKNLITHDFAQSEIDRYKSYDIRDDYYDHVYRTTFLQQHALNLSGGNSKIAFNFSAGWDDNQNSKYSSENNRKTLRLSVKANPINKLQLNTDISFSQVHARDFSTNQEVSYRNSSIGQEWPYLRLVNSEGIPIASDAVPYSKIYRDTAGNELLLDWTYNPLDEIKYNYQTYTSNDLLANMSLSYQFNAHLNVQGIYAFQHVSSPLEDWAGIETFSVRNRINLYSQYNNKTILKQPVPIGGLMGLGNTFTQAHTGRLLMNYNQKMDNDNHQIDVLLGTEIRQKHLESNSMNLYGFDKDNWSFSAMDYTSLFPTLNRKTGGARLQDGIYLQNLTNRYVSFFGNMNYIYKQKYILNSSIRQDASNLFGIKANNKWQPLWSVGTAWILSQESFLKSSYIDLLKIRATYGFSGRANVNYAALPIIEFKGADQLTGLKYASITTPPNPELRWERNQTVNLALDFAFFNKRLSGTYEWYVRNATDLLTNIQLDPTTGYDAIMKNGGELRSIGHELTVNSVNVNTPSFVWSSNLLISKNRTKVTKYAYKMSDANSYVYNAGTAGSFLLEGHDEGAVLAFPFAGLDPANGDPQGYLNGKVSKDYAGILFGGVENVIDLGPGRPTYYFSIANDLSYKNFSVRFNIQGRAGFKFFRSTFSQIAAADNRMGHPDYLDRWQKPGDEKITTVPSVTYPIDAMRDIFTQKTEALVVKGDNIRLQDIFLSYQFGKNQLFKSLSANVFVKNINKILWKANKHGIDPEYRDAIPYPLSISIGVNATL